MNRRELCFLAAAALLFAVLVSVSGWVFARRTAEKSIKWQESPGSAERRFKSGIYEKTITVTGKESTEDGKYYFLLPDGERIATSHFVWSKLSGQYHGKELRVMVRHGSDGQETVMRLVEDDE